MNFISPYINFFASHLSYKWQPDIEMDGLLPQGWVKLKVTPISCCVYVIMGYVIGQFCLSTIKYICWDLLIPTPLNITETQKKVLFNKDGTVLNTIEEDTTKVVWVGGRITCLLSAWIIKTIQHVKTFMFLGLFLSICGILLFLLVTGGLWLHTSSQPSQAMFIRPEWYGRTFDTAIHVWCFYKTHLYQEWMIPFVPWWVTGLSKIPLEINSVPYQCSS